MTSSIPTIEPDSFVIGSTVKWTKHLDSYAPGDGWVLTYAFVASGDQQTLTASDNGDGSFLCELSTVESGAFSADVYHWQAYVTLSGERFSVGSGTVTAQTDFSGAVTGFDGRSHAQKVIEAIEAVLENRASESQKSYSIKDRSLESMDHAELLKFRDLYRRELVKEERAARVAAGLGHRGRIRTRFV